jgi:hypothetical protein
MRNSKSVLRQRASNRWAANLRDKALNIQSDCAAFAAFWMCNLEVLQVTDPDKLQALIARQGQVSALSHCMRNIVNDTNDPSDPDFIPVEEFLPIVQEDVALHGVLYVETLLIGKALIADRKLLERMTPNEATAALVRYGLTVAIPSHLHNEFIQKVHPQESLMKTEDWTTQVCFCGAQSVTRFAGEPGGSESTLRCPACESKCRRAARSKSGHC